MRNQTLIVDQETETLLGVDVLLKACFDVKFVANRIIPRNTQIYCPVSRSIL